MKKQIDKPLTYAELFLMLYTEPINQDNTQDKTLELYNNIIDLDSLRKSTHCLFKTIVEDMTSPFMNYLDNIIIILKNYKK